MKKGIYEANGIYLSKSSPKVGDQLEIIYSGLLATSGAQQVRIHYGYNETWENAEYIDMTADSDGFKAVIPLGRKGALNFAFLDPIGNWDNYSGNNYSVEVKTPRKVKKETEGEAEESGAKAGKVSSKAKGKTDKASADGESTAKKSVKKAISVKPEPSGNPDSESKKAKSKKKAKTDVEAPQDQKAKRGPGRPKKWK